MTDPLEQIQKAELAALVRAQMGGRITTRRETLLTQAKTAHRAGTLTNEQARAVVAQLVVLDDLLADLDRDVRKGEEARDRLVSMPS